MQNLTTVYLRQRGSKPEVSEYVDMFHELRMWISCVSLIQYFAQSLFEITVDHKLQLHLSQNELFGIGSAVHQGVHVLNKKSFYYF